MSYARKILFFALAGLVLSYAIAIAESFPAAGEISGDKVHLRSGPHTKFQSLKMLEKGLKITVLGDEGDFYLIKCPAEVPVWISASFLVITGEFGAVKGTNINLRAKPVNGDVVGSVSEPTKMKVMEKKDDWIKVEAPVTTKVYVSKSFVKIIVETPKASDTPHVKTTPSQSPTPVKTPTPTPTDEITKKFENAEKLFAEAEGTKDILAADFSAPMRLYKDILTDPAAAKLHEEAERKIARCDFWLAYQEAARDLKGQKEELQKKLDELKKELERKLKELADERAKKAEKEEEFLATGWVYSIGGVIGKPATHRLVQGGKVLYLLKSDSFKLDDFWGQFVGVKGDVLPQPEGWEAQIIVVKDIKVLDERKRPPEPRK
jgi:uncharacterized protein YgiM (DUF1202 family)